MKSCFLVKRAAFLFAALLNEFALENVGKFLDVKAGMVPFPEQAIVPQHRFLAAAEGNTAEGWGKVCISAASFHRQKVLSADHQQLGLFLRFRIEKFPLQPDNGLIIFPFGFSLLFGCNQNAGGTFQRLRCHRRERGKGGLGYVALFCRV